MVMTKTLFFTYFLLDQFQTLCASSIWSTTKLNSFRGRSAFMVEICEPRGQILKLTKLCHVVPHMKALDEC
jgi:hypothetical protein